MYNPCTRLHTIFSTATRYTAESDFQNIPENGIYILFEKSESSHDGERIVKIGTHTGRNQLPSMIQQHLFTENKNRSLFRKNIGRCLLCDHDYAPKWEYNVTSKASKAKYLYLLDLPFEKTIEQRITAYIKDNISIVVIPVEHKHDRVRLETSMINTLTSCADCIASDEWLGNTSPKEKIKDSGLWQVNDIVGENISNADFLLLEKIMSETV